jgi:tetratricopeptide (TPR) repeat protein
MNRTAVNTLRVCAGLALLLAAWFIFGGRVSESSQARKAPAAKKRSASGSASLQSHRNLGKAYYEQGKYAEAMEEFQKVVASGHALATDHLDLGLALMQANKLDEALGELTTAKQMDPKLLAADYNLGILYKRELRYPEAEAALKRVIDADPNDPAAQFNLGTIYFAEKKLEEALDANQRVVNMGFGRGQNFYVASLFHTFTILVRLRRQPEAQKVLKVHEKIHDKVPGISLQNPALEGGKYGAILVPPAPTTEVARRAGLDRVAFEEITQKLGITLQPLGGRAEPSPTFAGKAIKASDYSLDFARQNLVPLFGPSIAVGDYDGDGRPDVYVVNPAGTNHLLHHNADGTFADVTGEAGVAGPGAMVSATFADYDNSGKPSLFVAGLGGVKLYRNHGDGKFVEETEKAGLSALPGELDTRAVLFDADNDGFLDLVMTAYTNLGKPPQKDPFVFPNDFAGATIHFYRNNGDGTFTEMTAASGLASAQGRTRGAVFADFDNDGYADLFLFRDDGPPLLYENQGEDKFVLHKAEAGSALAQAVALDAQVADFNHDGYFDLALWLPDGYQVLLNRRDWRFTPATSLPAIKAPAGYFAYRGMVADLNGDSFPDLLVVDASGKAHFVVNNAGRFQEGTLSLPAQAGMQPSNQAAFASLVPAWIGSPGKLDLVGLTPEGRLLAFEKEGPPARWLEVKLNGYKSNMQGIGSVVEFKAGNFYDKVVVTGNPIRVFTGDLAKLDVVRVTWPNAVVQNWVEVATNKPLLVRESERLASSCPLLYGWDGQRYVFLTDVLGVAPLGELATDGSRVKPYPEELVGLPDSLRDQNGSYVFQLTDELREVDYFDQVRLLAVDHPASEEIYANEIYSSAPTLPTLYALRRKHFPVSAVDDRGHDMLPLLLQSDGRYPTDFSRQRILGLAGLHTLTLDLGELPSPGYGSAERSPARRGSAERSTSPHGSPEGSPTSRIALWLKGWVFWTDSNGSRALMSNRQLAMVPPYLQVRDARGEWVTVIPDMGLPSGTQRTMRVDLTGKFLSQDHHVRIVTNLCVYWDQIFFTTDEGPAPVAVELPLASADLHYRGFSIPVSDPRHLRPDSFDYMHVLGRAPWNPMVGRYTRYGPVEALLASADDEMVVMATGDELTVKFDGRGLPPLRLGWKRDFFLYANGWAKDGEPNTAFAKTVWPLPFHSMANYPPTVGDSGPSSASYRAYQDEYLTRPGYSLIPPLAPAIR